MIMPDEYDVELPEEVDESETDEVVDTGLKTPQGAPFLFVYYTSDATYVVPSGEYQNGAPWRFKGMVSAGEVLNEYLTSMKEEGGTE